MNHYLKQALYLIERTESDAWGVKQAKKLAPKMSKEADLNSLVNSPTFQNVINVLAPYITNYNVRQAISLLQKLNDEVSMSASPFTRPIRRF